MQRLREWLGEAVSEGGKSQDRASAKGQEMLQYPELGSGLGSGGCYLELGP